jgi:hypothetical protein
MFLSKLERKKGKRERKKVRMKIPRMFVGLWNGKKRQYGVKDLSPYR